MSNDNDLVVGIWDVHSQPALLGTSRFARSFRCTLLATSSVGKKTPGNTYGMRIANSKEISWISWICCIIRDCAERAWSASLEPEAKKLPPANAIPCKRPSVSAFPPCCLSAASLLTSAWLLSDCSSSHLCRPSPESAHPLCS